MKHNFSDKLDDKGNIVQPITRPIGPSGGVLKDINNKIEKLQHDSKVLMKYDYFHLILLSKVRSKLSIKQIKKFAIVLYWFKPN